MKENISLKQKLGVYDKDPSHPLAKSKSNNVLMIQTSNQGGLIGTPRESNQSNQHVMSPFRVLSTSTNNCNSRDMPQGILKSPRVKGDKQDSSKQYHSSNGTTQAVLPKLNYAVQLKNRENIKPN